MNDCLFCKIVSEEIPCNKVYENDHVLAFDDIEPQAPVHVLIIPKKHITSINDLNQSDKNICSEMFFVAQKIAALKNIDDSGFRCVINTNNNGGQTVFHIHMHVLGGRKLTWPPG